MKESKLQKINSILLERPLASRGGKLYFTADSDVPPRTAAPGLFGRLQDTFKKHPRLYDFIVTALSATRPSRNYRRAKASLLSRYGSDKVIVNYGSGPKILNGRHDIINVDLFAFDAVDVVSDTRLPFKGETLDLLFSIAVLEHMKQPTYAVSEMLRCLKQNGELLVYVPFMQPVHAAPHDYQRWTETGLRELFKDFDVIQGGVGAGPTSGFLWVFQHWAATLLAFGNSTIKDCLLLVLMLTTFPLKHLDAIIESFDQGKDIASGVYLHCMKRCAEQAGAADG